MRAYERLIKYAKYEAASDRASDSCPSTPEQLEFGRALAEEMRSLGIKDAHMDENGYVFGTIEANIEGWKARSSASSPIWTWSGMPYQGIKPRVVENYSGGDIILNPEHNIVLSPSEYPNL